MSSEEKPYKALDVASMKEKLISSESLDEMVSELQGITMEMKSLEESILNDLEIEENVEAMIEFGYSLMDLAIGIRISATSLVQGSSSPDMVSMASKLYALSGKISETAMTFCYYIGKSGVKVEAIVSSGDKEDEVTEGDGEISDIDSWSVEDSWKGV